MRTQQSKSAAERRPDKYDTCPECGGTKVKRAKLCHSCHPRTGQNNPRWKASGICPICGGPKSRGKTKVCAKCRGFAGMPWWKMGLQPWDLGMPRDSATKQKISITRRERGYKATSGSFAKGHQWDTETTKRMFLARRKRPNKKEQLLIDLFLESGLPFRYVGDGEFVLGGRCPDFLNVDGKKQLIELYGNYWHRDDDPQERIDFFGQFGFETLVIWESELRDSEQVLERVRAWL